MVIVGTWQQQPITISVKSNCLTVSIERSAQTDVFSCDFAGRLWTAMLDGISYRRGLDGKMVAKWHSADHVRHRRRLSPDEALQIQERARRTVADLFDAIQSNEAHLASPLPPQGHVGFERAIEFDPVRSRADVAHYAQVYKPVGILPPDQYMAVVLQAAEGCAFNTCTFCDFYRDRPFRIKSPDEFRTHAEAVRSFLGAGLSLRRTIFLGDANALVTPMPMLLPLMEIVHQVYDVDTLGGIYAFLDGFSGEKKSPEDYAMLARYGLKRVYVGMESGNEALLQFLKKPGKPADAIKAVRAMKAGGVAVGVIVLLGAGGHAYAESHVRDTIDAINAMQLDMDDIIYFSELIISEGLPYAQDAYQARLKTLTSEERLAQAAAIEHGLEFSDSGGIPHISRYDIREFVY
jgi:radical SAM superfamily enzyme YgiQ (UPF0313 family)